MKIKQYGDIYLKVQLTCKQLGSGTAVDVSQLKLVMTVNVSSISSPPVTHAH